MLPNRDFFVYVITNLITGKWYVGKTGVSVRDRWTNHKSGARNGMDTYLCRSIRKYGEENFSVQSVAEVSTEEEANNLERIWIIPLSSHDPQFGYNLTLGGDGVRANEETKAKISSSSKGKIISDSTRAKMSAARKGKKLSPQQIKDIGDRFRGKPLTKEHRQKLSEAKQGKYIGEKHPMFGKKHAPESKEKMSQSKKGKEAWNKGRTWTTSERVSLSKGQKKRFSNPEQRNHLSSVSKGLWKDSAYRDKMKKAQSLRYAREKESKHTNAE